ncbi:STAS domain-containing protein [Amycolatopsis kentuckyensis]|uniref:STAS domain-containing protein n=1 Tax=Amycolatopsis kentuckyensis TaxID=218823 RepID=UPI0035632C23
MPLLSVERAWLRPDLLIISVAGEIDAVSVRGLQHATWNEPAPVTVFDLAKVTLLGAAGLRVLAQVARRAHAEDRVVALTSPPHPVSVVLLTFWNDRRVLLYSTLPEALRAHPAATGP